jgi:hypothetical protein
MKTVARELSKCMSGILAAEEVRWHNEAIEPVQDYNISMENETNTIISMEK